jgi:hypothetical protein
MSEINFSSNLESKKLWLFIILAGLFITNAVTAELISNKLIQIGPFQTIVGIIPWPFVFIITDLLNEFYGKKVVQRLSWITSGLILYCFIIVGIALNIPAVNIPGSNLASDFEFNKVFGQAQMVIIGSICAFLVSQLLDATLFDWIKNKTGNRWIWLRSTGSTVVSQLVDSFIVLYIGFVLPGSLTFDQFLHIAPTNYILKLMVALSLTPIIYVGHSAIRKYLSR